MRNFRNRFASGVSIAVFAFAGAAHAQDAANTAEPQGGLEEIVVTAQKQAQNLQDVPISVTAVTGETLADQQVNNVADLSNSI
ncbi:MAG TPA: TonB-dependent receptor, partial [Croceicoccus sp.]|nr:TonB-dependent receptor [Croceicoccus sp.]